MRIFQPIRDAINQRAIIREAREWCLSECKDEDQIIPGVKMMHSYKCIINRMVVNLSNMADKQSNSAIQIMTGLLNAVVEVTSQEDDKYSWDAIEQMTRICAEIVKDTGSISEQFAVMAQVPEFEKFVEKNPNQEE